MKPDSPPPAKKTNRLSKEKSPYLLQHQHNPVDWYPWGEEAFAKAKKENKPVLLSIGYSTCHWCHVMERESFESEEVAKVLNEKFVPIKLDREERPDVDSIYMTAMQAMQLGGGWPLNVFMTPDRKPFYGGTYFPKQRFILTLQRVDELWRDNRADLEKDANNLTSELEKYMNEGKSAAAGAKLPDNLITAAANGFAKGYDPQWAGFSKAPKFPQPQVPGLLLLAAAHSGDKSLTDKVLHTCRMMAAGGMYDQIGGGFSRYSVDEKWLVPHFEKMLYDNAQLIDLYLDAGLVSGDERYHDTVRDIIRYLLRDMTHKDGGFYSAEDADSEGHEGKFYCWTKKEIMDALGPDDGAWACEYYGITEKGNFEDHSHPNPLPNQNVLSVIKPDAKLSEADTKRLAGIKQKLFDIRAKRIRPHLDDKILTSWNGLMLGAISRASIILDHKEALAAARKNFTFVKSTLWDAGTKTLYHRWRDGERDSAQLLSAYAFYLNGCIDLYEATLDASILEFAVALAEGMTSKFFDEKGGGFYTSTGTSDLLFRVKDDYDSAEPSGNSVAILALLRLSTITELAPLRAKADAALKAFHTRLTEAPQAVPLMLKAAAFAAREPFRAVIAGDPAAGRDLLRAAHRIYQPHRVILGTAGPVEKVAKEMTARDGKPTAYICTGESCQPPTSDPATIQKYLTDKKKPKSD
ncbi:MAG TPA: thioredoxin domain-containing protein [Verrucomicrobiales bacterium]|nr:thioredoxin domain-containing protein [Verrucomicrobiales bacterium]